MLNSNEILQTLRMIDQNKLDVRTITMGISLLECAPGPVDGLYDRVYDRITRQAENLVPTGEAIEREFGIPIVNKRISVTPIALMLCGCGSGEAGPDARPRGQGCGRQLSGRLLRTGAQGHDAEPMSG